MFISTSSSIIMALTEEVTVNNVPCYVIASVDLNVDVDVTDAANESTRVEVNVKLDVHETEHGIYCEVMM